MPVDRKLINRKMSLIREDLKGLLFLDKISLKTFLLKSEHEALAERYLERIIGWMIDINYHILAEKENHIPVDYYNSFMELGEKGYLPAKFAEKIADSAGLRNRLAHEYDEIDEKKIYQAAKNCLKDVPKYLNYILKSLKI